MKFSLVLATVEKTAEVERFLASLMNQTYQDFELVLVDQNRDNRLEPILTSYYDEFPILHLRSETGLSRARNVGLQHISGDIVAFPDDDCWYPNNLLQKVANFYDLNPKCGGFTGRSVDNACRTTFRKWDKTDGPVNRFNVWSRGISFTIFLTRNSVEKAGCFNETLGVGANTPWGSGEETDYLLRVLRLGTRVYYDHNIIVYHPESIKDFGAATLNKVFQYGRGMGRVLRLNEYPVWFVAYSLMRPLTGSIFSLIQARVGKGLYHWKIFQGRFMGYFSVSEVSSKPNLIVEEVSIT
ncbi:MAG: glycosyltransferase family 2 protein [Thermodesulfobacteriota bacterium]